MKKFIFIICIFICACDNNQTLKYGETGLPKNCRAIIKGNIDGWHNGEWTAADALGSIDRNCGEFGYSW